MDSSQTLRNSLQISHKNLQHLEITSQHHTNNNNNRQAMKHPSHHSRSSSSRTTPSFSSSSSLSSSSTISSNDVNYSPLTTPNSTPGRFSGGVPFSWERFPGIPKKKPNNDDDDQSAAKLLPLMPPPTTTFLDHQVANSNNAAINLARVKKSSASFSAMITNPSNKASTQQSFETDDPFFAALVECSKDDHHGRESRSFSNAKLWSASSSKVSRSLSDRLGVYASCKRTCVVAESIRHLPRSSRGSYDLINDRSR